VVLGGVVVLLLCCREVKVEMKRVGELFLLTVDLSFVSSTNRICSQINH